MDDGDKAQVISDRQIAKALANIKSAASTRESNTHCAECGNPIPEKRRMAAKGCTRCAECQTEYEEYERRVM